jgi:UDP-N-acetylglucosamine 2-epimerase (hydrolysing)
VNKKILFLTGTRADFGKLKPLIQTVKDTDGFEYQIFGTGMHMLSKYGNTISEIGKAGFDNLFTFMNQVEGESMEVVLANTVIGLSRYLSENHFDLIVVHGDRVEALAGATVGAMRNILVAHIEGGELSGTIDELIRHSISKLSHLHFVASEKAKSRLVQLGELENTVFTIGSPDVDVMLSDSLPSLNESKSRYGISFNEYAIAMLHPVTTEYEHQDEHSRIFVDSLVKSGKNYIIVYPNNDHGTEHIYRNLQSLKGADNIRMFPSLRFEHFLTLLKHAKFIIGNSSAGIHEAPIYGVPTINIGNRQNNRFKHTSITDVEFSTESILNVIESVSQKGKHSPCSFYGDGKSADKFLSAILSDIWSVSNQKQFNDLSDNV